MTLAQRHALGVVVRCLGLALIALALIALEWAWHSHTWNDLEAIDGQCVSVGDRVDDGHVPVVNCGDEGARMVVGVVKPTGTCPKGLKRVPVRRELSHETGYIGALCVRKP